MKTYTFKHADGTQRTYNAATYDEALASLCWDEGDVRAAEFTYCGE